MPEEAILDAFLSKGAEATTAEAVDSTAAAVQSAPTAGNVTVDVPAGQQTAQRPARVFGDLVPGVDDVRGYVPTGGVGLMLLIILVVVFAIVPTSAGVSRLALIWQAFLGNASLAGDTSQAGTGLLSNANQYMDQTNNDWLNPPQIGSNTNSWGAQWGGGVN